MAPQSLRPRAGSGGTRDAQRGGFRVRQAIPLETSRVETLAWIQGGWFVITGMWPIVSLRSFERVTGPKTDAWLVRTVGVLVIAIGVSLIAGASSGALSMAPVLGVASAAGLGVIDVWYASRRVIAPVYLADALVEATFVMAWVVVPERWT
jgi:energy-converting hydrogenase Eha subunit E